MLRRTTLTSRTYLQLCQGNHARKIKSVYSGLVIISVNESQDEPYRFHIDFLYSHFVAISPMTSIQLPLPSLIFSTRRSSVPGL